MLKIYSLIVLVLCFRHGASIYCFECSSWNNSMCLDPKIYDPETLQKYLPVVECGQGVYTANREDFFCRKIVQSFVLNDERPEVRVTRGCGWVRSHHECYKLHNELHLETVCQCFNDGCNGGTAAESSKLVVMTAVSTLVLKLLF